MYGDKFDFAAPTASGFRRLILYAAEASFRKPFFPHSKKMPTDLYTFLQIYNHNYTHFEWLFPQSELKPEYLGIIFCLHFFERFLGIEALTGTWPR